MDTIKKLDVSTNTPIGEVALYYDENENGYCISIIIEAKYRWMKYSEEALKLLIEVAFDDLKKGENVYVKP